MTTGITRRSLIGAAAAAPAAVTVGSRAAAAMIATPAVAAEFGAPTGVALLSRNENPYGPAPSAIRAMADVAARGCYYADRGLTKLTAMIAERHGVSPEQVVVGSGSTEILCAIAMAWRDKGSILCPDLFWDTTAVYAERKGATLKRVALGADMGIDLAALSGGIGPDVGLIHICNPNNPTGMVLDGDALRGFVRTAGKSATVLVDEAYNELTDRPDARSVMQLVREGANLIVCRTFSKIYGMAGLRIGYSISSVEHAAIIRGWLTSFGGNSAGLAAAIASYDDTAFTTMSRQRVIEARGMILDAVKAAGLTALPSETNFVFVKVPDAEKLQKAMAAQGVMIRGTYGRWTQWSRVSTGRIEDVRRYAAALPRLVSA
ncbi:histidinol-phosphate aminotransferase [Sphingomonas zeicaulis]|uniref:pyridoxal phosphate-dependent aminotransferase n=1 Tax=Sphingomonas zeicaulis TaxID=1632740 RepID=UPI003D263402